MKGIVEAFFEKINFKKYQQLYRSKNKVFHPRRSVDIYVGKDFNRGSFGQILYMKLLKIMILKKKK